MSLGLWIRNVLDYRAEVAVPGVGVFKKTHYPASYYAKEQVFLPPYDQIDLVAEGEDSLELLDYLQIHYQLDSDQATAKLDGVLSDVFARLNDGETVYLDGLGQLENDRNVLKFSALETAKLAFEAVDEAPAVASLSTPYDSKTAAPQSTNKNWVLVMGLFLIAAVIGGIWFLYEPSGTRIPGQMTAIPSLEDSANDSVLPLTDTDSVNTLDEAGTPPEADRVVVDTALRGNALETASGMSQTTFEIIIGTFQTIDEAAEYAERLKGLGHAHVRILATGPGSRLHKVSWGAYATRDDAQAILREVQQRIEGGAWIDRINR